MWISWLVSGKNLSLQEAHDVPYTTLQRQHTAATNITWTNRFVRISSADAIARYGFPLSA